ncbi:MAG: RDD family protein, partial [Betaproteobacteria bacterium]|nr:RDD family protein [Betaproteobacteria bacterium]
MVVPSIKRRLAALPYEGLLLLAVVLIASFPAAGLKGAVLMGWPHFLYQTYLFCVMASYFAWFWRNGGQTLAMKTWRFKVVDSLGAPIGAGRALRRFIFALLFFGPACASLVLLFFPTRLNPAITVLGFVP